MPALRLLAVFTLFALLTGAARATAQDTGPEVQGGPDKQDEPGAGLSVEALAGTGFTYQGELRSGGSPVTGVCDFEFRLWDALSAGAQQGSLQAANNVIVTAGRFTVVLNAAGQFGPRAFDGSARWLAISVRCPAGGGAFTNLTPRQALTAAPLALALPGLRTEISATSPNVVGGYISNTVGVGVVGATIAGGGVSELFNAVDADYGTVGGGYGNSISGELSTVGGGSFNTASGEYASVGGGNQNVASDDNATVSGGVGNNASGDASAVGGGWNNTASGQYAVVGGGTANAASGTLATVSGGQSNTATNQGATAGGGANHIVSGLYATVSGGQGNLANGIRATVSGGSGNTASGQFAVVGGGTSNTASGGGAVVVGGGWNGSAFGPNLAQGNASTIAGGWVNTTTAAATYAAVGGGYQNAASNGGTVVGGGYLNRASADSAAVGGGANNTASGPGAVVSGGYLNHASGVAAALGGGLSNTVSGAYAAVSGGFSNTASNLYATVSGGIENTASEGNATVSGGVANKASGNTASVGGGWNNTASGYASTVPGGVFNTASGHFSFAAGREAQALHEGAFVWADANASPIASTTTNQFLVRASGGVTLYTNSIASTGVAVYPGSGSWTSASDHSAKANFALVDGVAILNALMAVPIETWNYNTQDAGIRHIGPMAQDFYAAFGVGETPTGISTVDADGVALAAIQGLYAVVQEKDMRIAALEAAQAETNARLAALESGSVETDRRDAAGPAQLAMVLGVGLLGGALGPALRSVLLRLAPAGD